MMTQELPGPFPAVFVFLIFYLFLNFSTLPVYNCLFKKEHMKHS
jgi:hypothetical protein